MLDANIIGSIKPADLPSPPQVALQIMRACAREDVSAAQLSDFASSDPALAAEMLRVVNSVYFGLSSKVQSIPRAITVLGRKSLRNLALCLSIRDALKQDSIPGFDPAGFWEDSIRRAASARLLAEEKGLDGDEYFTAGLLQDFGLLVLFYIYPEHAAHWEKMREQDPVTRYAAEQRIFHTTHGTVGMMLAEQWELPESLAFAIGHHHITTAEALDDGQQQMCKLLYCADWLAAVYGVRQRNGVFEHCTSIFKEHLDITAGRSRELITCLPAQVKDAAAALGIKIVEQAEFDEILQNASVQLAEQGLGYQELIRQLENTLRERDRLAAELDQELAMAREIQQSLLPLRQDSSFPVCGVNLPARELSGDFYDFFELDDGRIYFALGDVSGKGTYAALLMAKTCSLFRCLGKLVDRPGDLLRQINNEICETSIRGMFVTMIVGLLDPVRGQIEAVNAGNPPALLVNPEGRVATVDPQAPPLGILVDCSFPSTTVDLGAGSLYLFSDGVTEGQLEEGNMLGLRGIARLAVTLNNKPPEDVLRLIVERFSESKLPLRDDMTLMIVRNHSGAQQAVG